MPTIISTSSHAALVIIFVYERAGGDANSGRAEMETLKQQLEEEKKEIHAALTTAKSENQELKSTYEKAMQEAQELQRIEMEALRAENERLKRHHQQAAKLAAFPFPEAKLVDDSSSTTTDSDSSNGDSSGADDYFDFLKNTDDYGYGSGSYNDGNDSDTTSSSGGSVDMSGMEEWYGIASYYQDDEKEIGNSIKIDYFQGLDATASSSSASPSLSGQVSNMSLTDNKGANSDVNASDNNDYDGDFIMNLLEEATTMNLSDTAENASDSKLFDFVNDDAEQEKQSGSASSSSSSPSASAAFASASSSSLSSSTSVSHKLLVTIKALSKLKHSEGSFYAKLQAFTEDGISLFERRTTSQVLSTSGGNVVLNETFDLTTVLKNMAMKAGGVHLSSLEVSVYFEDTAKSALLYLGLGNEIVGSTTVRISDIPVAQVSENS